MMMLLTWLTAEADPVADLIERIRHPYRWALKHPLRAMGRQVQGRFN